MVGRLRLRFSLGLGDGTAMAFFFGLPHRLGEVSVLSQGFVFGGRPRRFTTLAAVTIEDTCEPSIPATL